jgi:hypothetical protein
MNSAPQNSTVVRVHAAWADGSSWTDVIPGLTRKGMRAIAAPLPLTSLGDDVLALKRTMAGTRGPLILAGHAYAGAVRARESGGPPPSDWRFRNFCIIRESHVFGCRCLEDRPL